MTPYSSASTGSSGRGDPAPWCHAGCWGVTMEEVPIQYFQSVIAIGTRSRRSAPVGDRVLRTSELRRRAPSQCSTAPYSRGHPGRHTLRVVRGDAARREQDRGGGSPDRAGGPPPPILRRALPRFVGADGESRTAARRVPVGLVGAGPLGGAVGGHHVRDGAEVVGGEVVVRASASHLPRHLANSWSRSVAVEQRTGRAAHDREFGKGGVSCHWW